jgi:hypothetical protein
MLPSREELLAKAAMLPEPPVAFGAGWDGDSTGWFVILYAMLSGEFNVLFEPWLMRQRTDKA